MAPWTTRGSGMGLIRALGELETSAVTKGLATTFMRAGLAKALGGLEPELYFRQRWPQADAEVFKTAVLPGSTSGWGKPIAEPNKYSAAFIETLRPLGVLGRLTGFRTVPFNTRFPHSTSGASVFWTGQSQVTAMSSMALETVEFEFAKICGIIPLTKELASNSDPAVEALVRADLAAGVAKFCDEQFLDPTVSEITTVRPASITSGATEIVSSGGSAVQVEADMTTLFASVTTNKTSAFLVMREDVAIGLAKLRTTTGDRLFPELERSGTIWRVPVVTSGNVPADPGSPSNDLIVLLDTSEIFLSQGDVEFDVVQNVTVQMNTSPDSPETASTVMVSFFQRGLIGVGVRRYICWAPRRSNAVAFISGVQV
jgi:HK97 family phage major capsid protein